MNISFFIRRQLHVESVQKVSSNKQKISALVAALKTCMSSKDIEQGRSIHAAALESGDFSNIYVANTLVNMYGKCGSMLEARTVFDGMKQRDEVSWTVLMIGYVENGEEEIALELFARMKTQKCCSPDTRAFVAALKACVNLAGKEEGDGKLVKRISLERGISIHNQAMENGFDADVYVATTLIDMYVRCGSLVCALRVFDKMDHRDTMSWTRLILGCVDNGEAKLALELFSRMQTQGYIPDTHAFVAVLKACTTLAGEEQAQEVGGKFVKLDTLEKGMAIHSQAVRTRCDCNIFVASTLVDMYVKSGSVLDARWVFEKMYICNEVSLTSLMLGYVDEGDGESALELFSRMSASDTHAFVAALKACSSLAEKETGTQVGTKVVKVEALKKGMAIHSKCGWQSDIFVANALVHMYTACRSLPDAQRVFVGMPYSDVISWNAMLLGYAENGEEVSALELFSLMQHRDALSYVAALKACGGLVDLKLTRSVHAEICRTEDEQDNVVANCLVDVYCKLGSMVDAKYQFDSLPVPDSVTWTTLIAGYSRQGETKRVFFLFDEMRCEGLQANSVTFLAVLTACSHAGHVEKGKACFEEITSPTLEHYHCMVDMFGRANQLDAAVEVVNNMPHTPTAITWKTVLSASRKWTNLQVGKLAFDSLIKLDPEQDPAYSLMGSIYGSLGMWEEQSRIESLRMKAKTVQ